MNNPTASTTPTDTPDGAPYLDDLHEENLNSLEHWEAGAQQVKTFRGHTQDVWSVSFAPDGLTLASGGNDRYVRIWDIETGRILRSLRGHTHNIRQVAYSPDGQTLATASEDRTIRLWNPNTGETTRLLFTRYDHAVTNISFSPDGLMLARAGQNKDIKIWEITTGTELMTLLGKDQYDHHWSVCTAFSPDGIHLVSGSDIGKLRLYEVLPSGEEKCVHNAHWRDDANDEESEARGYFVDDQGGFQKPMEYWIGALTYTPDGKTLFSGSRDCTIKLFEMPELREYRTLRGHSGWVRNLLVTADGKVLISASDDASVKMWNLETGKCFRTLKPHKGPIRGIALSADGRFLATASTDRTIMLWEGGA
ncbi:MAG: WD40 repeat domain-containing protein [Nitrospirales bacterium]|nr:WD40 repeat domain-containing protein [Nitrospira sp.]MDR4500103.1 WD40 repeat domain-containing protein [Nitrospirales bacterium]